MKKWLKRIPGPVRTGLIWAAGWSPIGAVVGLVVGVVVGEVGLGVVALYVWYFAALGFGTGAMFMFTSRRVMMFPAIQFRHGLFGCTSVPATR